MLEERALHPADESLNGALLIAAARCAHLDADAEVDDRLSEGGVVLLDVAPYAGLLDDRPGAIEDRHQRQSTEGDEVAREIAHDCLDALVVDERDRDEAGVLQSRREEVNAPLAAVDERDVHVPEVVLRELTGQPLEANHGHRAWRSRAGDERIERALVPRVSGLGRATQKLLRRQVRLLGEPLGHTRGEQRRLRRSADPALASLRRVVHFAHVVFALHASDRVERRACLLRDVPMRVARAKKNLDFVALEQGEHLPGLRVPATHFCGFHHPSPPFRETADFPERGAADFPEPSNGAAS